MPVDEGEVRYRYLCIHNCQKEMNMLKLKINMNTSVSQIAQISASAFTK